MKIATEIKETLKEAGSTTLILFKILIPVSIIIKILAELGAIEVIGEMLTPAMGVVRLPGEFGLVWATAMLTNIYGSFVVLFTLSTQNTYTVAQVTILGVMILLAHALPIEARIAQKAGVRLWFTLSLRILGAITLGFILSVIFTTFNLFQTESTMIWRPGVVNPTIAQWIIDQLKYYIIIFLIILGLVALMRALKKSGLINKLNDLQGPTLRILGINKNAAPILVIGLTLGLAYGGGLIIKEAKSKLLDKKDAFLSISLMGLSHSLIEDTLLVLSIGAALSGIMLGRLVFTFIVIFVLVRIIKRIPKKKFEKYFVN